MTRDYQQDCNDRFHTYIDFIQIYSNQLAVQSADSLYCQIYSRVVLCLVYENHIDTSGFVKFFLLLKKVRKHI